VLGENLYVGRDINMENTCISVIKKGVVIKGSVVEFEVEEFLERNPSRESIENCIFMLEGAANSDSFLVVLSEMKKSLISKIINDEYEIKKPPTMRF